MEQTIREQPDFGQNYTVLGLIDAALGHKEEAMREGQRGIELLPITRNSIDGAELMKYLGVIYAWCGEKDLAIDQIEATLRIPSSLSYGNLKLHPAGMLYEATHASKKSSPTSPRKTMRTRGNRADWIRTSDLLNPIQAHYQAVLRPEWRTIRRANSCLPNFFAPRSIRAAPRAIRSSQGSARSIATQPIARKASINSGSASL